MVGAVKCQDDRQNLKNPLIIVLVKWVDKSVSTIRQMWGHYPNLKFLYYLSICFTTMKGF